MAARVALHRGVEVLEYADDVADAVAHLTDGRGPDSVIDAVGMEAHGSPVAAVGQKIAGALPDAMQRKVMQMSTGWRRSTSPSSSCGAVAPSR